MGNSSGTKPIAVSIRVCIFLRLQSKIKPKIKSAEEISLVQVLKELFAFIISAGCMKRRNSLLMCKILSSSLKMI